MIYTTRYKNGSRSVDSKRVIGMFKEKGHISVSASGKEARNELIGFLESQEFTCSSNILTRDGIIEVGLPLIIDLKHRNISRIGNVTCAAAAASAKIIICEKEFYILYSVFEE